MSLWKDLVLNLTRAYASTSLRGRTRLTNLVHTRLCPPGIPYNKIIDINGVPFPLDLGERLQTRIFYGFYEPNEVAFVRRRLQRGETFVDVGANVGYYSALAASLVGRTGTIWAFEPVPWMYDRLVDLAVIGRSNECVILPRKIALADKPGETTLWTSKTDNIGWATIVPDEMPEKDVAEAITVETQRLDAFFTDAEQKPPDMVKIDVEFGEPAVLDGMSGIFETGARPTLLCEVSVKTVQEVLRRLEPLGYRPYECLKDGTLRPTKPPLPFHTVTWVFD